MNPQKYQKSVELINKLVSKYDSQRHLAKAIYENPSDVSRWCAGKLAIKSRAIIEICRLHPDVMPYQLNHMQFPDNVKLTFIKERK